MEGGKTYTTVVPWGGRRTVVYTAHGETRQCFSCEKRCYIARQNRQPILYGCVQTYTTLSEGYNSKTIVGVAYYGGGECEALLGFVYSDWAGRQLSQKPIMWYLLMLNGGGGDDLMFAWSAQRYYTRKNTVKILLGLRSNKVGSSHNR